MEEVSGWRETTRLGTVGESRDGVPRGVEVTRLVRVMLDRLKIYCARVFTSMSSLL